MRGPMKKIFVFSIILSLLVLAGTIHIGYAQKDEVLSTPTIISDAKKSFIQNLIQSISFQAADLGFDYYQRPVLGILVSDFCNSFGESIEIGNEISSELRAALNKEKQFHVYGKEHPVNQSLKASLIADPLWKSSSQRNFQLDLLRRFKSFPVDWIVTGQISPEAGNRLKVTVNLIPFDKPISLVESETGRTDIRREQFLSPALSTQEIEKGLSVIQIPTVAKGRLVIVALMKIKKSKQTWPQTIPIQSRTPAKINWDSDETTGKVLSFQDITCWLDDKELTVKKDWEDFKKKEYLDILSGFGADTIWFDDMIKEGPHSIFISLAQDSSKNKYKTFSKSFTIKGETSNYLVFSIYSDLLGESEVRVHHILDPENRSLPF